MLRGPNVLLQEEAAISRKDATAKPSKLHHARPESVLVRGMLPRSSIDTSLSKGTGRGVGGVNVTLGRVT
jgi:hypothetical protein